MSALRHVELLAMRLRLRLVAVEHVLEVVRESALDVGQVFKRGSKYRLRTAMSVGV